MRACRSIAESYGSRAKHADRQHRASQRCILIARQHKLMKRSSTPSGQYDMPRPERWASLRALHKQSKSSSAEKHPSLVQQLAVFRSEIWAGSEWDSSSAYRPGKAGQAFTLAWQSAIRLARRSSSSPRHRHGRQRTNDWRERASDDERSLPERKATSSKFPASWQTSSGVGAISRHRTPNTGVPAARLALRQSELASALARVKRRRRLVGWQQTMRQDCRLSMRWLASRRTRQTQVIARSCQTGGARRILKRFVRRTTSCTPEEHLLS
jgi:hypothetical protein